jgi:hypothetical protein
LINGGSSYICAVPSAIGDPCANNSACGSDVCDVGGWCTGSCTSDATCGTNSAGEPGRCVDNGAEYICFPGCTTNTDCAAYPGTTCQSIPGAANDACSLP